jgi:hypothetical protein
MHSVIADVVSEIVQCMAAWARVIRKSIPKRFRRENGPGVFLCVDPLRENRVQPQWHVSIPNESNRRRNSGACVGHPDKRRSDSTLKS